MAVVEPGLGNSVDMAILHGVARPCPDCAEERLFVPTLQDEVGDFSCTWCGAALFIDPSTTHAVSSPPRVAGRVA
jgi:uncharacterized protein (DUF983 family)